MGGALPVPFRRRPCFDCGMEQQSIRIETLGDLAAHGYGLNATCERCRHRADLDLQGLIAKFGAGFRYIGRDLDRRLTCGHCGGREIGVQVRCVHSNRSRFAD
jgi:transcription elongation factor Elf1